VCPAGFGVKQRERVGARPADQKAAARARRRRCAVAAEIGRIGHGDPAIASPYREHQGTPVDFCGGMFGLRCNAQALDAGAPGQVANAQERVRQPAPDEQLAALRLQRHQRGVHAVHVALAAAGHGQRGNAAVGDHQHAGGKGAQPLEQHQQLVRVHAVGGPPVRFFRAAWRAHTKAALPW